MLRLPDLHREATQLELKLHSLLSKYRDKKQNGCKKEELQQLQEEIEQTEREMNLDIIPRREIP